MQPHFTVFDVGVSIDERRGLPAVTTSVPHGSKARFVRPRCDSHWRALRFCAMSLRPCSRAMRTPYAQVTRCFDSPNQPMGSHGTPLT